MTETTVDDAAADVPEELPEDDALGDLDADEIPPPIEDEDEVFDDPDYDPANDEVDAETQGESFEEGTPGAGGEEDTGEAPDEPGGPIDEPTGGGEGLPMEPEVAGGAISVRPMGGQFIAARGYRRGRRAKRVLWVVVHTAEGATDEVSLGKFFSRTKAGSSHGGVGQDGGYANYVNFRDTAWTNPPVNDSSDSLEICGFAKWKRAQWLAHPKTLETVARWIAWRCAARGVPIRHVTGSAIRKGVGGVIGHKDINDVFKQSSHWDPGPNFPWDIVIPRARQIAGLGTLPKPVAALPVKPAGRYTVKAGDSYWKIAQGAYRNGQLWPAIAKANGNKALAPGMVLTIPAQGSAAPAPVKPAAKPVPAPAKKVAPVPKKAAPAAPAKKPAPPAWPGTGLVAVGKRNGHVQRLQKRLMALGFKIPAGATGFYGDQTKTALAGFQKKHPPTWPADGVCGPVTWRLLFS